MCEREERCRDEGDTSLPLQRGGQPCSSITFPEGPLSPGTEVNTIQHLWQQVGEELHHEALWELRCRRDTSSLCMWVRPGEEVALEWDLGIWGFGALGGRSRQGAQCEQRHSDAKEL